MKKKCDGGGGVQKEKGGGGAGKRSARRGGSKKKTVLGLPYQGTTAERELSIKRDPKVVTERRVNEMK